MGELRRGRSVQWTQHMNTHRSFIWVYEEDLDDDLELPPACLCDLIGGFGHH